MMIVTNLADVEDQLRILDSLLEAYHDNSSLDDEDQQRRRVDLFVAFEDRFTELLRTVQTSRQRLADFEARKLEEGDVENIPY